MHVLCYSAYQNVSMLTGERVYVTGIVHVYVLYMSRVLQNNSKRREIEEIK